MSIFDDNYFWRVYYRETNIILELKMTDILSLCNCLGQDTSRFILFLII